MRTFLRSFLGALWAFVAIGSHAQTTIQSTSYSAGQSATVVGPNTIDTSGSVTVGAGAVVRLEAANSIRLAPGFSVQQGASFLARINPSAGAIPVITSSSSASGTLNNAFSFQIAATNTPTSYAASGLPSGLGINAGSGLISGAPTSLGVSNVTISATNSAGTYSTMLQLSVTNPQTYSLNVNSGTGGSSGGSGFLAGTSVSITANTPPAGQVFNQWVINSGPGSITQPTAVSTTFVMGAGNAVVTATYTNNADPNADNDGDGMPNGWESQHGLNPQSASDALVDADGDGLSNVAEYNLGLSPTAYNAGTATLGGSIPSGWPNSGDAGKTATYAVGTTAGALQVDKSGAAGYSVELWATPGTAGMEPKLSLGYSSQGGAGWLGFGWSLGGVSAITRGPQTLAVDGQIKGLSFTATDRFYLDGQRLILVSGSYGANGAEYRTEMDSISKIVSYGTAGSGPAYFKVWTKAGLIIELGNTTDSAAEAQGRSEVATWSVNRISDTVGNYMTFSYAEDNANGEHRLTRIDYTGNSVAGTNPYASVRLGYEARTDTFNGYVAGSKVVRTQRIKTIGTYYGETLAREYTFDYTERPNTGRSLLTALREKGKDGKEYPPLTFAYEAPAAGWSQPDGEKWGAPVPIVKKDAPSRGTGFVDLNGDGRPDFVRFHRWAQGDETGAWINDPVQGWVSTPAFIPPAPLATDGVVDTGARFADVNNDGLPDFVQNGVVHLNTGTGWSQSSAWSFNSLPNEGAYPGTWEVMPNGGMFTDLNGDGRVDFMGVSYLRYEYNDQWFTEEQVTVYLNTGTGWQRSQNYEIYMPQNELPFGSGNWRLADRDCLQKGVRFFDVNGDGLPDFLQNWYGDNTSQRRVALNTGTGFVELSSTQFNQFIPPKLFNAANPNTGGNAPVGTEVVDLNGDGLADLIYNGNNDSIQSVAYLNTGAGWVAAGSEYLSPHLLTWDHSARGVAFLDINGDGLADLVKGWEASDRDTRLGTGRGWSSSVSSHNIVRQMGQGGLPNTGTDYVDINADGMVDQIWNLEWNGITKGAAFNTSRGSDRLVTVTNGFGVAASLTYAPLTERDSSGAFTVYTKGTTTPNPETTNVIGPMYVVKTVTHDDGAGGQYAVNYRYGGLRAHRVRGSQGFEWQEVTDSRTGIVSKTTFSQVFPTTGMPVASETRTPANVVLSSSAVTYATVGGLPAGTYQPYASQTVEISRDLLGTLLATTTTAVTDLDTYGNVKAMSVTTVDHVHSATFTKITTSTFTNDTANWRLGRLTRSEVASTSSAGSATRVSAFGYDPSTGLLTSETVEPDTPALALTTAYEYDAFGNKKKVSVTGASIAVDGAGNTSVTGTTTRATETQYDARGRFPAWTRNAVSHQENYTAYDQELGVLTAMTGANGLPTSWQYDGMGRKTLETRADGTQSIMTNKWAGGDSPAGSAYLVETQTTGAAPALAFYDSFGRARYGLGISGDGRIVYQQTAYDSMGRAYAQSVPYYNDGSGIHWTQTTSYDLLNRPLTVTTPDDQNGTQTTTYSYSGYSASVTDAKGRVSETVKNSQGWTLTNIRNKNAGSGADDYSSVSYGYDALGNLTSTNAAGVTTSLNYDARGRKTSMVDPSMGTWHYRYNGFGELIWQKDNKGQIVEMAYDHLGRLFSRTEAEGTTTWVYDTAPRGGDTWKGKLHTVTAPGGYGETNTYDSLGRPLKLSRTIDGAAYDFETAYDSVGRPIRTIYPATGIGSGPVSTRQVYNAFGFLKEIRAWSDADTNPSNGQLSAPVYWQADTYDVTGRVNGELYGNGLANDRWYSPVTGRLLRATIDRGAIVTAPFAVQDLNYTYDGVGNVTRRYDVATGRDEYFYNSAVGDGYDGLDRLKVHRISGGATVTVSYDQKGNITAKSDVGSYGYSGYGPHAVSSAGAKTFTYDAVGNMLEARTGATVDRAHEWTSFNQLRKVTSGAVSSEFAFGAAHERVKQVRRNGSTVTETTVYVGSLYEKVTIASTDRVEHKHYIVAPSGRIAVLTVSAENGLPQANNTRYFHTDGLGSITTVSDEKGAVLKRYTYDAWGKQTASYTNTAAGLTNQAPTTRGFTDHEMLTEHGLIHMNGRVYDPVLGRFLSADPFVGDADDSQSFNRYSYVSNNPLNASDPSGYFKLSFGTVIKIVAAVVISVVTYGAASGWAAGWLAANTVWSAGTIAFASAVAGGAAAGFASGFASSLLNGGSIGDAFKSGLIGGGIGAVTAGLAYQIAGPTSAAGGDPMPEGWQEAFDAAPRLASNDPSFVATLTLNRTAIVAQQARGILAEAGMAALQGARAYAMGLGQGIWGAVRGTASAIAHPINTINGVANGLGTLAGRAIYDTAALGSDIWNGTVDTISDPSRLGNAVGSVVGGVAIGAGVGRGLSAVSRTLAVAESTVATEGIYQFTAASGRTYVGQSGNIAARIEQHLASGKLLRKDLSSLRTTEVLGGKTAREIAEQLRINQLGGIKNLENIRNPIGPGRQHLLPK